MLGGHLAVWNPYGLVVVCQPDLIERYEGSPRHPAHRVKHVWVIHTGPPSRRYQLLQYSDLVAARRLFRDGTARFLLSLKEATPM